MVTVHTIGHGTLPAADFAALLVGADVERVVDIRSFPGSRHNPQYGREEMERWVPDSGLAYSWYRDLGGRRRPVEGSRHIALRNESFRAYADYMESPTFVRGVAELLDCARTASVAVMCSESVWWRCHRRLLADHLILVHGVDVRHIMHDGRVSPHPVTDGVRVDGATLVYDVGVTPPLDAPR